MLLDATEIFYGPITLSPLTLNDAEVAVDCRVNLSETSRQVGTVFPE
jgi:hypothetical protein